MASSASELQALLRFLAQDAKVPLSTAMSKVKDLQKSQLSGPEAISKSNLQALQSIFSDEKLSKQILSAAKRVSKKRTSSDADTLVSSPTKRKRALQNDEATSAAAIEESLALPTSTATDEQLREVTLLTNRAPLVLACTLALLKYTMPEQPLSSRLSLAQAVVSVNSRSKAVSIGLESGKSAEEEGWGEGQPTVKIMGREIRALKRWGYEWREERGEGPDGDAAAARGDQQESLSDPEPALWGLDLEALRSSNAPQSGRSSSKPGTLPIYTAQSARAYLLKSFASETANLASPKKLSAAASAREKEVNLGLLLRALDLLYNSWAQVLDREELDRRAWHWYVRVRPEVEAGVAGWGAKGKLQLSDILSLRRTEHQGS
ncbi:MAG: hypothetical protein M1833_004907 [Piccolia ochrophora]|nr:MAG: hypothetical protein M1833_004907 [Piccolia ochrophora]